MRAMQPVHVRQITDNLQHAAMLHKGLIPDLSKLLTSTVAGKRYPPFVYANQQFSEFGYLMDMVIRSGLRINLPTCSFDLGNEAQLSKFQTSNVELISQAFNASQTLQTSRNMNQVVNAANLLIGNVFQVVDTNKYVATTVTISQELSQIWLRYQTYLSGVIRYNVEYQHQSLFGHPDVVTDMAVLDIKTTTSFAKMADSTYLQLLAYVALARQLSKPIRYVGIILPIQREILLCDISTWNSAPFLEFLIKEADKYLTQMTNAIVSAFQTMELMGSVGENCDSDDDDLVSSLLELQVEDTIWKYYLGCHINKGTNICQSLQQFHKTNPGIDFRPCQLFISNPRGGKSTGKSDGGKSTGKSSAAQLSEAKTYIEQNKLKVFIHAPYTINLCNNAVAEDGHWQQKQLNSNLDDGVAMASSGVVVHTGARTNKDPVTATKIMEEMLRSSLAHATVSCPVLLETPCGEGTEILTTIDELGNFFFRFTADERQKMGICVDTCHVFAAGYDPLQYLEHWLKYCPVPIKLVHFNDSVNPCGSHVDRHARPGHGHIGLAKMKEVAEWCIQRQIPMVLE